MIKIGNCYVARLTKTDMPVRIESLDANGQWKARSLLQGRVVYVKFASDITPNDSISTFAASRCETAGLTV